MLDDEDIRKQINVSIPYKGKVDANSIDYHLRHWVSIPYKGKVGLRLSLNSLQLMKSFNSL